MRTWSISIIAAAALLAAPDAAAGGWYLHVFAGLNEADDTEFGIDAGTVETSFDGGTLWGIAFGYQFEHFRLEGEIDTSRTNDVDRHALNGVGQSASTGEVESEAGIANILFDFRRDERVSPYLGIGAGVAEVEVRGFGVAGLPEIIDDEDNLFTYQALAGVGVDVGKRWVLDFSLRYYETQDAGVDTSSAAGGRSTQVAYDAISLTAGFRYDF